MRLPAEADGDGDVVGGQEGLQRGAALGAPAGAADHGDRLLRLSEQRAHVLQRGRIGERDGAGNARQVGDFGGGLLHLLRQRDHHRSGPAGGRDVDGVRDDFRGAVGGGGLRHPFREGREHLAVVDFLERVAAGVLMRDLADEQQHGRAVLEGDVHADRAVAGAGAARDEGGGGTAGELAVGFGHVHRARLEAAGDELQLLARGIQPVERVEEALPRHFEHVVDSLRDQCIRENVPAQPRRDPRPARLCQFHAVRPPDRSAHDTGVVARPSPGDRCLRARERRSRAGVVAATNRPRFAQNPASTVSNIRLRNRTPRSAVCCRTRPG